MANSVDPDQTAPIGPPCLLLLNSSVMLGNYLQQTTLADNIFRCLFFLGALRVRPEDRFCCIEAHMTVALKVLLAHLDHLLVNVCVIVFGMDLHLLYLITGMATDGFVSVASSPRHIEVTVLVWV